MENQNNNREELREETVSPEIPKTEPETIPEESLLAKDTMVIPVEELLEEAPKEDAWLDEILGEQPQAQELEADEQAVAEVGLIHPEELALEEILSEVEAEARQKEAVSQDATQLFTPVEDTQAAEVAEETVEEEVPEAEEKPLRKRRPKMKKGYGLFGIPHLVVTAVWLAIILAIGLYMGRVIWLCAVDVLALNKVPEKVTVTVTEYDDIAAIAEKLKESGMIRYPKLFQKFAELTGKGEDIDPGNYTFNEKLGVDEKFKGIAYDYNALIMSMQDYGVEQDTVKVLFPEGYNCAQIFALLEEKGVCTVADLEEYAANGELDDYWFLEDVERGHRYCLEGYLSADTYEFYTNDEPKRVLEKFLDEFDDRFTERLQQKFEEVNQRLADKRAANGYSSDYIEANKMTLHDIVVLASIIEKETASNLESFDIALVYYNRLADPDDYPYLNSKATMKYAEEYYYQGELNTEEAKETCEFNTNTQAGLPDKPICNPSLNSMAAALNPKDGSEGNYFYFVYDEDSGSHRFAESRSEYQSILNELGLAE